MPSYKTAFPSKYLKAEDLESTRPIITIAEVEYKDVGFGKDVQRQPVVTFDAPATTLATPVSAAERVRILEVLRTKQWILNRTNCKTIAAIAGTDDYLDWTGTAVELFATTTEFGGERVACIRCVAPKPIKKGPSTPPKKKPAKPAAATAVMDHETESTDDTEDD